MKSSPPPNTATLLSTHLERIEAGDNSAVFHLAALGRVGELALAVRPGARPPLELAAHFQRQPLGVPDLHVHVHGHVGLLIGRPRGVRVRRRSCLRPGVCDECGSVEETGRAKDMRTRWSKEASSKRVVVGVFFGGFCWIVGGAWRWPTTCSSSSGAAASKF